MKIIGLVLVFVAVALSNPVSKNGDLEGRSKRAFEYLPPEENKITTVFRGPFYIPPPEPPFNPMPAPTRPPMPPPRNYTQISTRHYNYTYSTVTYHTTTTTPRTTTGYQYNRPDKAFSEGK